MAVEIKIRGLGRSVDYYASVVFNALVKAGLSVTIEHSPHVEFLQPDQLEQWTKRLVDKNVKMDPVRLTVEALPWGG